MNFFEAIRLCDNLWESQFTERRAIIEDLPNKPGIYCILFDTVDLNGNPVQCKYVGQSKHIATRIEQHLKASEPGGRDYLVYRAMRKHPYKVIVLESFDRYDPVQLDACEIKWIRDLHTYVTDTASNDTVIIKEFNGEKYTLTTTGPGYNLTPGGGGFVRYTPEIIDEIIELYKLNDYNHTKTYHQFRALYKDHPYVSNLSWDTLYLIIDANDLPWTNELEKPTLVYANRAIRSSKRQKNNTGYRNVYYWATEKNTTDSKYCVRCESQAQAQDLVDYIWQRFKNEQEINFQQYLQTGAVSKKDQKNSINAIRLKWLEDNSLYDTFLDLTQYDLNSLPRSNKSRGGEKDSSDVFAKYRGGLCTIIFNGEKCLIQLSL